MGFGGRKKAHPMREDYEKIRPHLLAKFGEQFEDDMKAFGQAAMPIALVIEDAIEAGPARVERISFWVAAAIELGLQVGQERPEFARRLVKERRYGRELVGDPSTTSCIEAAEMCLVLGERLREGGSSPGEG